MELIILMKTSIALCERCACLSAIILTLSSDSNNSLHRGCSESAKHDFLWSWAIADGMIEVYSGATGCGDVHVLGHVFIILNSNTTINSLIILRRHLYRKCKSNIEKFVQ